eukprot:RCo047230
MPTRPPWLSHRVPGPGCGGGHFCGGFPTTTTPPLPPPPQQAPLPGASFAALPPLSLASPSPAAPLPACPYMEPQCWSRPVSEKEPARVSPEDVKSALDFSSLFVAYMSSRNNPSHPAPTTGAPGAASPA